MSCGQQHIPDAEGRCVGRVNHCCFIHAVVPRHVETIVLLCRKAEEADRQLL